MTSPLLGTAMVLLSEGCTYGAKGALRLTTRGVCEAHVEEERKIGFRSRLTFEQSLAFFDFRK